MDKINTKEKDIETLALKKEKRELEIKNLMYAFIKELIGKKLTIREIHRIINFATIENNALIARKRISEYFIDEIFNDALFKKLSENYHGIIGEPKKVALELQKAQIDRKENKNSGGISEPFQTWIEEGNTEVINILKQVFDEANNLIEIKINRKILFKEKKKVIDKFFTTYQNKYYPSLLHLRKANYDRASYEKEIINAFEDYEKVQSYTAELNLFFNLKQTDDYDDHSHTYHNLITHIKKVIPNLNPNEKYKLLSLSKIEIDNIFFTHISHIEAHYKKIYFEPVDAFFAYNMTYILSNKKLTEKKKKAHWSALISIYRQLRIKTPFTILDYYPYKRNYNDAILYYYGKKNKEIPVSYSDFIHSTFAFNGKLIFNESNKYTKEAYNLLNKEDKESFDELIKTLKIHPENHSEEKDPKYPFLYIIDRNKFHILSSYSPIFNNIAIKANELEKIAKTKELGDIDKAHELEKLAIIKKQLQDVVFKEKELKNLARKEKELEHNKILIKKGLQNITLMAKDLEETALRTKELEEINPLLEEVKKITNKTTQLQQIALIIKEIEKKIIDQLETNTSFQKDKNIRKRNIYPSLPDSQQNIEGEPLEKRIFYKQPLITYLNQGDNIMFDRDLSLFHVNVSGGENNCLIYSVLYSQAAMMDTNLAHLQKLLNQFVGENNHSYESSLINHLLNINNDPSFSLKIFPKFTLAVRNHLIQYLIENKEFLKKRGYTDSQIQDSLEDLRKERHLENLVIQSLSDILNITISVHVRISGEDTTYTFQPNMNQFETTIKIENRALPCSKLLNEFYREGNRIGGHFTFYLTPEEISRISNSYQMTKPLYEKKIFPSTIQKEDFSFGKKENDKKVQEDLANTQKNNEILSFNQRNLLMERKRKKDVLFQEFNEVEKNEERKIKLKKRF